VFLLLDEDDSVEFVKQIGPSKATSKKKGKGKGKAKAPARSSSRKLLACNMCDTQCVNAWHNAEIVVCRECKSKAHSMSELYNKKRVSDISDDDDDSHEAKRQRTAASSSMGASNLRHFKKAFFNKQSMSFDGYNAFEIIGMDSTAECETVKKKFYVWRSLINKSRKSSDDVYARRTEDIEDAYTTLMDKKLRDEYVDSLDGNGRPFRKRKSVIDSLSYQDVPVGLKESYDEFPDDPIYEMPNKNIKIFNMVSKSSHMAVIADMEKCQNARLKYKQEKIVALEKDIHILKEALRQSNNATAMDRVMGD
jgi:hypothetical protein